jgi:hypothetical protein
MQIALPQFVTAPSVSLEATGDPVKLDPIRTSGRAANRAARLASDGRECAAGMPSQGACPGASARSC